MCKQIMEKDAGDLIKEIGAVIKHIKNLSDSTK
jgi:hypothetical protein